jgi:hypothetical protein
VSPRAGRFGRRLVAILALAAGMITGLGLIAAADPEAQQSSNEPAAAWMWSDDVHGPEVIGTQPPRAPAVVRAADVARLRSVVLVVAVLAAGVACLGISPWSRRRVGERLAVRRSLAWAWARGPRAPPFARAS